MGILSKIKSIIYSLPFGMKAAESEITGNDSGSHDGNIVAEQKVSDRSVAKHLLKGEVTQEVEELRYRTYEVERESAKYEYIGGGNAVKKDIVEDEKGNYRFTQENKLICEGVGEILNFNDKYTITVEYPTITRFTIDKFATAVDVRVKGHINTTVVHFSQYPNPSRITSKPFVLELEKLYDAFKRGDKVGIEKCYIFTSFHSLSFTTYKASNDQPDLFHFAFITPKLENVIINNGEYLLTYSWGGVFVSDLTEKFYSKTMAEKYKNKEPKQLELNFDDVHQNP